MAIWLSGHGNGAPMARSWSGGTHPSAKSARDGALTPVKWIARREGIEAFLLEAEAILEAARLVDDRTTRRTDRPGRGWRDPILLNLQDPQESAGPGMIGSVAVALPDGRRQSTLTPINVGPERRPVLPRTVHLCEHLESCMVPVGSIAPRWSFKLRASLSDFGSDCLAAEAHPPRLNRMVSRRLGRHTSPAGGPRGAGLGSGGPHGGG